MAEMRSKIKALLVDVLREKSPPDWSRNKLKDCISMDESFSNFPLSNNRQKEENVSNVRKPLHSGLSRSTGSLRRIGLKKCGCSKSESDLASKDLNGNLTSSTATNAGKKSSALPSRLEFDESVQTPAIDRKATKKRIKMLRWLKKALIDKGQDNVTVIGDIYEIDSTGNHVKFWCLLSDRQLNCYLNVSDTTPDFVIPLDNCIAVPYPGTMAKQYLFDIEKDGVKLATFAARSAKERARWIEIVKTKRGTIPLGDFGDESGEEAGGSVKSEEEDNVYVEVDTPESGELNTAADYVLPVSEDGVDDAGYISVIALESEVMRQQHYNPNIASKSGIEFLIEKDMPLFFPTIRNDPKRRLPAPLPKDVALKSAESTEISKGVPARYVDGGTEKNIQFDLEPKLAMKNHADSDDEASCSEENGIYYQVTASSWLPDSPPWHARFVKQMSCEGSIGAWRPEISHKLQFLEIDIGDAMTLGAIGVKGRPNFEEKGGEFVKSFTVYYSIDKLTWFPYKRHGKLKVFQGISNASLECKKYFKNTTVAQYLRIYAQSWHNHIALQVALYKGNGTVHAKYRCHMHALADVFFDVLDMKSKAQKKKGNNSKPSSLSCEISPVSPTMAGAKKTQRKKEDISYPIHPFRNCLRIDPANFADFKENGIRNPNTIDSQPPKDGSDNPATIESCAELRERLLSQEKREQITKLKVLKKHVDQAKDKMILVNSSGQLKRVAIESEHDYLTANLELVKAKKRLIDIETEVRELRLFRKKYSGEQQLQVETSEEIVKDGKPAKNSEVETPKEVVTRDVNPTKHPQPKRRPSKEVKVCTDVVFPIVDREAFNSPGDSPPAERS